MRIRHVIFDLDHTLIDSSPLIDDAWTGICTAAGLDSAAARDAWSSGPAVSLPDTARRAGASEGAQADGIVSEYERFVTESAGLFAPCPGAAQALLGARERRCSLAVSSMAPQRAAEAVIEAQGWGGVFGLVFGWSAQMPGKREHVREIARRAGVPAHLWLAEAMTVGDGPDEMRAGQAEGVRLRCGYDPGGGAGGQLAQAGANLLVSGLSELEAVLDSVDPLASRHSAARRLRGA